MKPLGLKPIKFPFKISCNKKGFVSWWEYEIDTSSKKTERANAKKEIAFELFNYRKCK